MHITSSDDHHSQNPCSHSVQGIIDDIAVEYPNHSGEQHVWKSGNYYSQGHTERANHLLAWRERAHRRVMLS